ECQGTVAICGRRVTADHGPLEVNGQLNPLTDVRELGVALRGHLHVDAHALLLPLGELVELGLDLLSKLVVHTGASTLDDDVHRTPFIAWPSRTAKLALLPPSAKRRKRVSRASPLPLPVRSSPVVSRFG